MSTKRLWMIAGAVALVIAILVVVAIALAPAPAKSAATPSATPSATPTRSTSPAPSPSASATPRATFTPPVVVAATCENTSTAAFRAMTASNGWVSWETQDQAIGVTPFDDFPNGRPDGAIVCRWGADPNLATDNILDLARAPIDPENAVAAMQRLEEQGFVRTETPDGVYLSVKGEAGRADDEGWGATYYFGIDDVRWAATKAETQYVKAPSDPE